MIFHFYIVPKANPIKYPIIAANIPIIVISNPDLIQFPIVNLAFIAPVTNKTKIDKINAIVIL